MDEFSQALLSSDKNSIIPEEYDWYAPLIGNWDFDYYDSYHGEDRHVKGEWLFRRVLNGMAIEDLFICPSRDTRDKELQPDGEYGAAIRMFNTEKKCYDMTYVCSKYTRFLEIQKEHSKIICTDINKPTEKWVFSEITTNTFHWQNVTVLENGAWKINSNVYARRK